MGDYCNCFDIPPYIDFSSLIQPVDQCLYQCAQSRPKRSAPLYINSSSSLDLIIPLTGRPTFSTSFSIQPLTSFSLNLILIFFLLFVIIHTFLSFPFHLTAHMYHLHISITNVFHYYYLLVVEDNNNRL